MALLLTNLAKSPVSIAPDILQMFDTNNDGTIGSSEVSGNALAKSLLSVGVGFTAAGAQIK